MPPWDDRQLFNLVWGSYKKASWDEKHWLQAVLCIAAFSLGVSFVFLPDNTRQQALIRYQIGLAFAPMQGFFNMAILICEKVDSHRQFYVEGGICDTANKMSTPDMICKNHVSYP